MSSNNLLLTGFAIITWTTSKKYEKPGLIHRSEQYLSIFRGPIFPCNGWSLWWTPVLVHAPVQKLFQSNAYRAVDSLIQHILQQFACFNISSPKRWQLDSWNLWIKTCQFADFISIPAITVAKDIFWQTTTIQVRLSESAPISWFVACHIRQNPNHLLNDFVVSPHRRNPPRWLLFLEATIWGNNVGWIFVLCACMYMCIYTMSPQKPWKIKVLAT